MEENIRTDESVETLEITEEEVTIVEMAEEVLPADETEAGTDGEEQNENGVTVIGVRFRTAGKVYFFDPGEFTVKKGMHVIVETSRGIEYGTVVSAAMEVPGRKITQPLRPVIRIATQADEERESANREKERDAIRVCKEKIRLHELEMKLIDAEYTFDNSKLLFYFTADGRVDFRDLVKDLASVFRTRIELRQIGVRDETQRLGGYGSCGRPLCCHTWLTEFIPVSIKMAKEQNLSLNQSKISGVCGRLMCCLKNEVETYEELNRNLPKQGDEVEGNDGLTGIVESVNVLRQTIRILVEVNDEKELHEYGVGEFTIVRRRRKGGSKARTQNQGGQGKKEGTREDASAKEKNHAGRERAEKNADGKSGTKERSGRNGRGRSREGNRERSREDSGKEHRKNS